MLRWDVVHVAQPGQFHIYAVTTADEALDLLAGIEVGIANEEGIYPLESFNGQVEASCCNLHRSERILTAKSITKPQVRHWHRGLR